MIDNVKLTLYLITTLCYVGAGSIDLIAGKWKLGILAILYGICNAIIFLWRPQTGG